MTANSIRLKTLVAIGALALVGCTSSGGTSGGTSAAGTPRSAVSGTAGPSTSATIPSVGSSAGATAVSPGSGLSAERAKAALLSAAEVGSGLKATANDPPSSAFPCTPSAPPLDQQVPPRVKVESTFTNATQDLQFSEEIDNYGDAATVAKALGLGEQGLACAKGRVGAISVAIQGPVDLSASIKTKVDKVEAWSITATGVKESIIVSKIGPHLVVLTFGATADANDSAEDAAGITQRALAKVKAATG